MKKGERILASLLAAAMLLAGMPAVTARAADYGFRAGSNAGPVVVAETTGPSANSGDADTVAGFHDVHTGDYYAAAVKWAKETGITTGKTATTFSPAATVTRAEAVTFLWRAMDRPEPQSAASPFTDVTDPSAYYYKSILWAAEKGMINGVGGGKFGWNSTLTYEQILTLLCRAAGGDTSGDWSQKAQAWAAESGLTDALTFTPTANCPRSDVVYCLWKQLADGSAAKPQDPSGGSAAKPQDPSDAALPGVTLHSSLDWAGSLRLVDSAVARPYTGYAKGYYAISNGDGTLSGLVIPQGDIKYDGTQFVTVPPAEFYVERYDAQGNVVDSKTIPHELPIFGAFLDAGDCFYIAFGQANTDKDNDKEVYRIVQYDRQWNRLGAVSVNGGDSYTMEPYRSTISRMALRPDGNVLALYTARTRYDGHQSNITILMNTNPFSIQKVMGEQFPSNHVSHSFGQFVHYDGASLVTVDHGDAYPRSFVLQKDGTSLDLLAIAGSTGANATHAIGSGFEVSQDGYLFLGCSTPQEDFTAEESAPWQVFLACTDKDLHSPALTWLTAGSETIDTARLVKVDDTTFLILWGQGSDVHYLTVDAQGDPTSDEAVLTGAAMPTTQPVVYGRTVLWIGTDGDRTAIYSIEV